MLKAHSTFDHYAGCLADCLAQLHSKPILALSDAIVRAWCEQRFVFVIGNGGSALTASHWCEDFGKSLLTNEQLAKHERPRLKILSLTDNVGWITALANDLSYEQVFVQQLINFAGPGDLLLAISGSGNSANVLAAVEWAGANGLTTFGLTGFDGGRLRKLADHAVHVPSHDMGLVESAHLAVLHWTLDDVVARIHLTGELGQ